MRKNCSSDREKFKAEGKEFAKENEITSTIFRNRLEQFLKQVTF